MKKSIDKALTEANHIFDLWLPIKMQYAKIPGLSICIRHKGKIFYQKALGYLEEGKEGHVLEDTVFHVASNSKMFTAVAIMQLVERKLLKLKDPASKYVEWFRGKNKKGDLENITIEQLLTNTSGVWRDGNTPHWTNGVFPQTLTTATTDDILILKPSTEFKYSNYGFSILGQVIESVSGMSWEAYIQVNILNVLKMNRTYPDYSTAMQNVARGHGRDIPKEKREVFDHYKANAYAPSTGIISSAEDLTLFLEALTLGSKKLLSDTSKRKMMKQHKEIQDKMYYGFGLKIYSVNKRKIIGHDGGYNGYLTRSFIDTKNQLSVVLLTNSLGNPAAGIQTGIFKTIYDLIDKDKYKKKLKNQSWRKYEGLYRNPWSDEIIVTAGSALVSFNPTMNWPLEEAIQLISNGENTFKPLGIKGTGSKGERVVFSNLKDGKSQEVKWGATPSKRINQ
jgi:D-alanyl-D-alanine carboxypeptidase